MSATSRKRGSADGGGLAALGLSLAVIVLVGGGAGTVHLGNELEGGRQDLPANPIELAVGLIKGTVTWPATSTVLLAALGFVLLLVAVLVLVLRARRRKRRPVTRIDRAARHMGKVRDLQAITPRGATVKAKRFGVDSPGLPVGETMAGTPIVQDWESVSVDLWGPRTGKTTARAVPAVLAAPGNVVATSNKRDLTDATRDQRATTGTVWIFDPQAIAGEPPTWWWNPLSYVTDEVKARQLARIFVTAGRDPNARTDGYFDPAATDLLANLLHAAALNGSPITQVLRWLLRPFDDSAAAILDDHGFLLSGDAVRAAVALASKQRDGVYGTATTTMSFLNNAAAMRWVTGDGHPAGTEFSPAAFADSPDTLFLLSKEGEGSTGPLVTALTVAVTEAAEVKASRSPGGRLAVPMVVVLDEAANICRWHNLPDLYSHFGSRGIIVLTFLQSYAQGVEVWGREGMRKLWSAANLAVVGGGIKEPEFLQDVANLVGYFEYTQVSRSTGKGSRTTSRSTARELTLDVADLTAMPVGRAVVLSSGSPAVLIRTRRWQDGPHAAAVAASIAAHDPAAVAPVVDDATRWANAVPVEIPDVPTADQLRANNPWVRQ